MDYGFIGVRELGSVYEGLLEFSLRIADEDLVVVKEKGKEVYVPKGSQGRKRVLGNVEKGAPYLVNDKKERKATGSYYTPRYIVDYIVENTLGPLVAERREALEEIAKLRSELGRMRKNEDYIAGEVRKMEALRTLLDVKVLDPAMGSGHFLVAAVDYLTDEFSRIISELEAEPVVEELADLRAEIRESLEAYGATASEEQLSDDNLLKRMVLKRCVYGVDLNEMAVELAKLSLWLDAFTVGAPLSFLDHHLKQGNSLIGSSVREVRREVEASGNLLGNQFTATLIQGTELMQHVGEIPDATEGEVRESIDAYATADKVLAPYKRMLDIWTSQYFGSSGAQNFLSQAASTGEVDHLTKGNYAHFTDRDRDIIDNAIDLSADKNFFHWELEFPEVFYEGYREQENPGFDAVVGNPPYFNVDSLSAGDLNYLGNNYSTIHKDQNDASYYFLYSGAARRVKVGGLCSLIVARYFLEAKNAGKLREQLSKRTRISSIIDFKNTQIWPDVNVLTSIVTLSPSRNATEYQVPVCTFEKRLDEEVQNYLNIADANRNEDYFSEELRVFTLSSSKLTGAAWLLVSADVERIKQKMISQSSSLNEIAQSGQGMKSGLNEAFVVDDDTIRARGLESDLLRKYVKTRDLKAYNIDWRQLYLILALNNTNIDDYPNTKAYLEQFRQQLETRFQFRDGTCEWYALSIPQNLKLFNSRQKLLTPLYSTSNKFAYDNSDDSDGYVAFTDVYVISLKEMPISAEYILALVNSRLFNFYCRNTAKLKRDGYYEYSSGLLNNLPIRRINFAVRSDERKTCFEETVSQYTDNNYESIPSQTASYMDRQPEGSGIVHDLLSYLANEMTIMHNTRVEIEDTWQEWVEAAVPDQHKLTRDFRERAWVKAGLEHGWEGIKAEFQARKAIPSGKDLQRLRQETEEALSELRPLYERIQKTDDLIDQIVYRLYGLTEEEISVVEASVERG